MPTTKKRTKTVATVEAAREAAGKTWFDVSDEVTHIELSSRDHGDVGEERAGKADIDEGRRLLKLLRKKFREAKWVTTIEVVDEWVSVNLRKAPLTEKELASRELQARMVDLRKRMDEAVAAVNEAGSREGCREGCRRPASCYVYDGCGYFKPSIKVVFGKRLLYLNHLEAGSTIPDEVEAAAVIEPLVAAFPEYKWTRTVRESTPRRTGNCSPPHNIIEHVGYIEYETQIHKP